MDGTILSLPQYTFMAWCLVKHRDKFTFTFIHIKMHNIYIEIHLEAICFLPEKKVEKYDSDSN
jgi:hypothetical protein